MGWWRSEEMSYISFVLNADACHACVHKLGEIGAVQFEDLNPDQTAFQRRYVSAVKRCEAMERKLRYFEDQLEKFGIAKPQPEPATTFLRGMDQQQEFDPRTAASVLDGLERVLGEKENELVGLNRMHSVLNSQHNERLEHLQVLAKTLQFYTEHELEFEDEDSSDPYSGGRGMNSVPKGIGRLGGGKQEDTTMELGSVRTGRGKGVSAGGRGGGGESSGYQAVQEAMKFALLTGVLEDEARPRFERMVFRVTRGNCYARFDPIEDLLIDPETVVGNEDKRKCVFTIFYQSTAIERKLRKICAAFNCSTYDLESQSTGRIKRSIAETEHELRNADGVLARNREACVRMCSGIAGRMETWRRMVQHEKVIYITMNLMRADVSGMLRASAWVVSNELDAVRRAVEDAHGMGGGVIGGNVRGNGSSSFDAPTHMRRASMPSVVSEMPQPWPEPPTFFYTNGFTQVFQELVDTYGVPRYREINPAVYTAVTFPFLFGVMYGDIGHGSCLFVAGLFLILSYKEGQQYGELGAGLYLGRYMVFLMGVFAVYCGFIYNDFFSLTFDLFGSKWSYANGTEAVPVPAVELGQAPTEVYAFGIDPAWHDTENELMFYNSFKMKISVILGIAQMLTGLMLKGMNCVYTNDYLTLIFDWLPQLLFACSLFGYMVVLIVYKWSVDWNARMLLATDTATGKPIPCPLKYGGTGGGCQPPALISSLIDIVLSPGYVNEPMFAGQSPLQSFLLSVAMISVPVMLLAKPLLLRMQNQREQNIKEGKGQQEYSTLLGNDDEDDEFAGLAPIETTLALGMGDEGNPDSPVRTMGSPRPAKKTEKSSGGSHGHGHGDKFDFSELMIHQMIETIEFVLGMVSNTASYLRLWALSLAHSELALVFWGKVLKGAIESGDAVYIFIAYAIWMAITFAVLLCMDVLECFLHALRLHWVEFQNKFYHADGHKFQPLCFTTLFQNLAKH